uniref:Putative invertase inhibitor n=1 Tax=Platanus orientalis TaxID=122832 RepID=PLAO1_PLAOI|nr:RecName: Full=Putative invertase inhibitor; AltName: Full=Pollen allergen Pla or 1; AltName: Full=Pollen allergen Pla or 1.0101; AltName: Allergen=Pla or 1.0101; Flags: Precursor [Platanus orientalis]ABY21305.1 pollen allergen Pla o 1 [Platanus orientalis]
MKLSFSLCIFFLISADIVQGTCKKVAQRSPNVNYDFCVKSLGADPKSHSADLQGLGVISANLAIQQGSKIQTFIGRILKSKVDPALKKYLNDCVGLYADAKSSVQEAIADFKSKDYASANVKMSAALDDSVTCEDGFKEKKGIASPVTKENKDYVQLTAISLAITKLLGA